MSAVSVCHDAGVCATDDARPGADFTSADVIEQLEAARMCLRCPLAEMCRTEAWRLHTAHAASLDRYGALGVWGGMWFEPGRPPRQLVRTAGGG